MYNIILKSQCLFVGSLFMLPLNIYNNIQSNNLQKTPSHARLKMWNWVSTNILLEKHIAIIPIDMLYSNICLDFS